MSKLTKAPFAAPPKPTRGYCRICRGDRDFTSTICLGCGSHRGNALGTRPTPSPKTKPRCPGCGLEHSHQTEPGRWVCDICHVFFEEVELLIVDKKAEKAAEWRARRGQTS